MKNNIIILSLEKKANNTEASRGFERWNCDSDNFRETHASLTTRKEKNILRDLLNLAHERSFYCSLKRKYFGKSS